MNVLDLFSARLGRRTAARLRDDPEQGWTLAQENILRWMWADDPHLGRLEREWLEIVERRDLARALEILESEELQQLRSCSPFVLVGARERDQIFAEEHPGISREEIEDARRRIKHGDSMTDKDRLDALTRALIEEYETWRKWAETALYGPIPEDFFDTPRAVLDTGESAFGRLVALATGLSAMEVYEGLYRAAPVEDEPKEWE